MIPQSAESGSTCPGDSIASVIERAVIDEARTLWMSRLAHDFANSITGITSLSENCLDDAPIGSALRESLELIRDTSLQAHGLLRTMASISQSCCHPEFMAPDKWLRENDGLIHSMLPKDIQIQVTLDPAGESVLLSLSPIYWSDFIAQALLLTRRAQGINQVTLATSHENNQFTLTIFDNGPGLSRVSSCLDVVEIKHTTLLDRRLLALHALAARMGGVLTLEHHAKGMELRLNLEMV